MNDENPKYLTFRKYVQKIKLSKYNFKYLSEIETPVWEEYEGYTRLPIDEVSQSVRFSMYLCGYFFICALKDKKYYFWYLNERKKYLTDVDIITEN